MFLMGGLVFVPQYSAEMGYGDVWEKVYVFGDDAMVYFEIPFYILFPLSRIVLNKYLRMSVMVILVGLGCVISLISSLSLLIGIVDFVPLFGTFIQVTFFPIILTIAVLDWKVLKETQI